MTSRNPIMDGFAEPPPKRTAQEWCDHGNEQLAGRIPMMDGSYIHRPDVYWRVENGRPTIGFRPKLGDE